MSGANGYEVKYLETGLFPLISAILGLGLAGIAASRVFAAPNASRSGDEAITKRVHECVEAIQDGARAFLRVEYSYLAMFLLALFVLVAAAIDWRTGICYLVGASLSALCGYIGMMISTHANGRTAFAAELGLNDALRVAFNSGSVMGLSVVSLALGGLAVLFLIFDADAFSNNRGYLAGFGMGASSVSLFTRVGGGIFTKAADVGADLVGKIEQGIPEDDPRNPAVIADNVGDNVGDVAGMGADIFGSFAGSIIACSLIGTANGMGYAGVALPYWISASGIFASAIGMLFVRTREGATQFQVLNAIRNGLAVAAILQFGFIAIVIWVLGMDWKLYATIVIGLACGRAVGFSAELFTSFAYTPTRSIAKAGLTGAASVIIQGLSVGMLSTIPSALIIAACVLAAVNLSGYYGLALASVGLLSNLAISLATDAFGPVADNAGGIAEMAGMPSATRDNTDVLDALGNTTAAVGKGFAMCSAVLTGLALLTTYARRVNITQIDILSNGAYTMSGALVGAMLPFAFGAVTMAAVAKAARGVVVEVRRQFAERPGIMLGTEKPDYARCVAYVTTASIQMMVLPACIVVFPAIILGIGLGKDFLAGMLIAEIVVSFSLGLMMSAAGGAWDNAKKLVESGVHGGKKSPAHTATIVGDTVGDPFKDTSGPSLNILVKLSTYMGVVLAPLFRSQQSFWWVSLILIGILSVALPLWLRHVNASLKLAAAAAAPAVVSMDNPVLAAKAAAVANELEAQTGAPAAASGDAATSTAQGGAITAV